MKFNEMGQPILKYLIPPFHSSQSEVFNSSQNEMAHSIPAGMECHSLARLKKYAPGLG
jgi:hypothetical protein